MRDTVRSLRDDMQKFENFPRFLEVFEYGVKALTVTLHGVTRHN